MCAELIEVGAQVNVKAGHCDDSIEVEPRLGECLADFLKRVVKLGFGGCRHNA